MRSLYPVVIVLLALLHILLSSCRPVAEQQLVDTWTVSAESLHLLPSEQQVRGQLELGPQGIFKARELPGELFGAGQPVTGSGEWRLVGEESTRTTQSLDLLWEGHQTIRLSLATQIESGEERAREYGSELYVQNTGKGLQLYFYSGDPDEGRWIYFSRQDQQDYQ